MEKETMKKEITFGWKTFVCDCCYDNYSVDKICIIQGGDYSQEDKCSRLHSLSIICKDCNESLNETS